jgi:hypothetical protein
MPISRRSFPAIACGILLVLSTGSVAAAYSRSGVISKTGSGTFEWCDDVSCTYWFSYVKGTSQWYTYLNVYAAERRSTPDSPPPAKDVTAPFDMSADLTNGRELWADGQDPVVHMSSNIYYYSGSYWLTLRPTGPACYTAAYPGGDILWEYCTASGISWPYNHYPPGSTTSNVSVTLYGETGIIGTGNFSGSLY